MSSTPIVVVRDLLGVTADQTSPASATSQVTTACAGFGKYKAITIIADLLGAVGKDLTTTMVLAAGNAAGGHWFDQLRVRYVGGASTSAGAAQVIKVLCVSEVFD